MSTASCRFAGLMLLVACSQSAPPAQPLLELNDAVQPSPLRTLLRTLAADSYDLRQAASPGYARAAKFVAEEMQRLGLVPAGDSGYFQRVAAVRTPQGRLVVLPDFSAWDTIPAAQRVLDVNVVGLIEGTDPELREEVASLEPMPNKLASPAERAPAVPPSAAVASSTVHEQTA